MKLPRRKFLQLAAGAAALPALPRIARAQAYPTRAITMVVPFAPGGSNAPSCAILPAARRHGRWKAHQDRTRFSRELHERRRNYLIREDCDETGQQRQG